MLQIRLSTVSAGDGGGGAAKPSLPVDTVMVACPDHLILADLPVAKGIGSITSAAASTIKSVGRRSRRNLGERVHFCVRCDFPIAIYGRLIPCEHAFCLACARSDSSCYLCDERIQKIQTIKMMEGIFICAAPHCLKSFLKKSEFESHVHEIHADLLQPNAEREGGYETDAFNITRPSSTDPHKQSVQPESSTARAPPRSGFSPNSNPQLQDRDDRTRRHQSREPTPKPQLQPKPPQFHSHHQHQPGDPQPENHPPQGFDRPYNWFHNPQSFDNQGGSYYRRDADQFPPDRQAGMAPESSFSDYPPQFHQPPNYQVPVNANQALNPPPSFTFPPLPAEGSQPYFNAPYETPRPELVQESGSEQGSVLGLPPGQVGVASFPDSYPRPWGMGFMGVPFQPIPVGQGFPEVYPNPTDFQGRVPFFQGDYSRLPEGLALNPLVGKESEVQGGSADHNDGKGVLAPIPVLLPVPMSLPPPPPPPLLPPLSQQLKRDNFSSSGDMSREGQGYGWQNDQRGFGNVLD